jgi:glycerophosphoryl diester phosphodiesterase
MLFVTRLSFGARLLRATGLSLLVCLALAPVQAAKAFDLQGHRGARGLAPENTLAAFRTALALGVDTLELDVGVTRDGVVVIAHDQRLNPNLTRDAAGRWLAEPGPSIHSLTLAELQRYDVGRLQPGTRYAQGFAEQRPADGERIPTLAALFEMVRAAGNTRVRFNIETKLTPLEPGLAPGPEAFAAAVLAVVESHGLRDRVSVQSFDWRTLQAVQRLAPGVATVALTARQPFLDNVGDARWTAGLRLADHGGSVPRLVKALGAGCWSPFHGDLDEASLAEARALGLTVVPWTVNEPAQMERLVKWGVDGLITDHPDRLRAVLSRLGKPLPPR